MKKILLILLAIAAIIATVLSVTPLFKLAYIPAIAALILGVVALWVSKAQKGSKKSIQLFFLMTIIALALTTYKAVYTSAEVGDLEEMKQKEEQLEEESLDELEQLDLEI